MVDILVMFLFLFGLRFCLTLLLGEVTCKSTTVASFMLYPITNELASRIYAYIIPALFGVSLQLPSPHLELPFCLCSVCIT